MGNNIFSQKYFLKYLVPSNFLKMSVYLRVSVSKMILWLLEIILFETKKY